MNKKLLIVIVVLVTALVVGGAALMFIGQRNETKGGTELGDQPSTNINSTEDKQNTNNLEYADGYEYWGVKEITAPTIPDLTWETKTVTTGVSVNIATTPFDYDIKTIYQNLKENDYMQENYYDFVESCNQNTSGELYNDVGYQMAYYINDSISANKITTEEKILKYISDFSVNVVQDTSDYANTSSVKLIFNNLDVNNIKQEEIFGVAKVVFGDYAEYLVYGKDSDGRGYNSSKIVMNIEISERIKAETSSYYMTREFRNNIDDTVNIEFSIGVAENPKENIDFKYYGLDNTSIYNSLTYNFEDLISESFGARNPLEFSTFGNGYFKSKFPNYTRTLFQAAWFESFVTEDGRKGSNLNMHVVGGASDIPRYNSPELNLEYYVEEDGNGQITDLRVWITGECNTFGDGDKEGQEAINALSTMIKRIFPDFDLTGITYVEGQKNDSYRKDVSTTILGKNVYGSLSISPKMGKFTIDISLDGEVI